MLWACVRLPDFSLQLLLCGGLAPGAFIVTSGGNCPEVLSCNPEARSHGIQPGMKASAAYALAPDLVERPRDARAERQALERVAAWAGQFTSAVSLAPPDALLLEIGGSLRLFGGLHPLLLRMSREIAELGYAAALATAPTATAAHLLARAGLESAITDLAKLEPALAQLPLALLDQPDEAIRLLAIMGVRTIGECLALPRDGLARRFGPGLLDELDRALGRLPDPRIPYQAPTRYKSKLALPAPVEEAEALLFAAKRLILELAGFLRMKQAGVTRLDLTLHHPDRTPTVVKLRFALASRDPQRILLLLRERLSSLQLPDRVEAIGLESTEARPLDSSNLSLFPEDRLPEEARWLIIEHLRARLGAEAVHSIASYPDHRPERAWRVCEPGEGSVNEARVQRPLWLLEQPRPLQTENELPVLNGALRLLAGPERIESGWWDEEDVQRDYFIAADEEGIRFWIFRDRCAAYGWFLQGVFG